MLPLLPQAALDSIFLSLGIGTAFELSSTCRTINRAYYDFLRRRYSRLIATFRDENSDSLSFELNWPIAFELNWPIESEPNWPIEWICLTNSILMIAGHQKGSYDISVFVACLENPQSHAELVVERGQGKRLKGVTVSDDGCLIGLCVETPEKVFSLAILRYQPGEFTLQKTLEVGDTASCLRYRFVGHDILWYRREIVYCDVEGRRECCSIHKFYCCPEAGHPNDCLLGRHFVGEIIEDSYSTYRFRNMAPGLIREGVAMRTTNAVGVGSVVLVNPNHGDCALVRLSGFALQSRPGPVLDVSARVVPSPEQVRLHVVVENSFGLVSNVEFTLAQVGDFPECCLSRFKCQVQLSRDASVFICVLVNEGGGCDTHPHMTKWHPVLFRVRDGAVLRPNTSLGSGPYENILLAPDGSATVFVAGSQKTNCNSGEVILYDNFAGRIVGSVQCIAGAQSRTTMFDGSMLFYFDRYGFARRINLNVK